MHKTYFAIQQAEREADIYIFGDITSYPWMEGEASAATITNQIKNLDVDTINVHIDSYGGEVSEGWGIYNALREHTAKIRSYADGFVASAALYPFLAGDERIASNLSAFYLHEVMTGVSGYADDLRKAADEIDMMTDIGIKAFVEAAGMEAETVRELMESETWLSPEQALEYGIVTSITADRTVNRIQAAKRQIMQHFAGAKLTHTQATEQKKPEPVHESEKLKIKPGINIMQMLSEYFNAKI